MNDLSSTPEATRAAAASLHADLKALREGVVATAERTMSAWTPAISDPAFRESALNMAQYLALRQTDLRPLQHRLAVLGLSTLGRSEAHVLASLDAVLATLARLAGLTDPSPHPDPASFDAGAALLCRRRDALFGGDRPGPQTRIMATLPSEAATDAALLPRLVAAGIDAIRINCAHDDAAAWAAMVANLRAADLAGRIAVSCDIGGPKVRTVDLAHAKHARLTRGDRFLLLGAIDKGQDLPQATLSYPELLTLMTPGTPVWIDDGKLRARAVEQAPGRVLLEVTGASEKGSKLKPEKGVNLPGIDLAIPALTDEDRRDLDFVAPVADIVGFSFVQTVEDVQDLLAALDAKRGDHPRPAIMLKIETNLALRNLPQLIVAAGGAGPVAVMIARGDLAVEIGFDRLSEVQDEILWLCEAARVPVVWATQVLDGMLHEGMATRAEATDAAMGQRAECVMLNKGPFLPETVAFLRDILGRMDRHQSKKFAHLGPLKAWHAP